MSSEIQPPARPRPFPRFPHQTSPDHPHAAPDRPAARAAEPPRAAGLADAFTEPRWTVAARTACAYDHARTTGRPADLLWADEYAAGVLTAWTSIDRLLAALDTLGVR